jgi:5-methyltetrahydropteroyltriglutamate--homocysteine methyltransferase
MRRSRERILTTHTGSLPRPPDLVELMVAREQGLAVDDAVLDGRVAEAVREVVALQVDAGVDVVNDGEVSKPSYSTYVKDRLTGFEGESRLPFARAEDEDFPGVVPPVDAARGRLRFPTCTGPIRVRDAEAVRRDIDNLRAARGGAEDDVFMTAVSPGQIARFLGNAYYPSHEAYVFALADAMQDEYEAIAAAGFVLQVDCPDLASGRSNGPFSKLPLDEWRAIASMHVAALNHALRRIPPERIRLHLCWGNYAGPHHRDVPLADIIDIALAARVGALSFEAANPRHAHEWRVFRDVELPEGLILIPGVVESCSLYIEHPDLVAERLERFVGVVGFENVIAGTDCGFGTFVGAATVPPAIAWAKLRALADGARRVTR